MPWGSCTPRVHHGRYISIQQWLPKICNQRQMVQKFSLKFSRNSRNGWISEMPEPFNRSFSKFREQSLWMKRKQKRKVFENFGISRVVVLFYGNFENAAVFATGNCRKFKRDVLDEWKAPHISGEIDSVLELWTLPISLGFNQTLENI